MANQKPTICILGGTPSTSHILDLIPDSIKSAYNFISFNRPGFGGSPNSQQSKRKLYQLAKKGGVKKNGFGVIGISGGGPLAILLASHFHLQHCGIISEMVSNQAFFAYADQAVTKDIMLAALSDYKNFEKVTLQFPNVDEIVKQAGASSRAIAIRACFDEFRFLLSKDLFTPGKANTLQLDWWHGVNDVNVPIQSAATFIADYPNAKFNRIHNATHGLDANIYINKLLVEWR